MVRLEYPVTEEQESYLHENYPPKNYPGQLDWIYKQVGGTKEDKYAVFNKLAVKFLRKNGIKVVIVLDNLDRIDLENQELVWQMVRMESSRINLRFVITSGLKFINQTSKEGILYSFIIEKSESVEVNPPPLYSILAKRKSLYFINPSASLEVATSIADNTYAAANNCPPNDRECLLKTCPDRILSDILNTISREKIKDFIESISNCSITKQLNVIKSLLQYPFCDWICLGKVVDEDELCYVINNNLIIDAAARAGNYLCNNNEPFFINIYNANNEDDFSNSLCMFFIIKIIYDGDINKTKLYEILQKLGHKEASINQALKELTKYKLINCDYSDTDDIRISQNEPVFTQYLNNIIFSLFYIQAMAYITPMKKDYIKKVPLPEKIDSDSSLYKCRIIAACTLIQQIDDDMKKQIAYIKKHEQNYMECQEILKKYNIESLVTEIKKSVKEDVSRIYIYDHAGSTDDLKELLCQFD